MIAGYVGSEMQVRSIKTVSDNQAGSVGILDKVPAGEVVEIAINQGYNHLVQTGEPETMREIRASRVISRQPDLFINFPVSSTLRPRLANAETEKALTLVQWTLTDYASKQLIIAGVNRFFEETGLDSTLRDDVAFTADEFMCNVLFNARRPNGINQSDMKVTMEAAKQPLPQPALVRIGAFNGSLAISCRDCFGTLDPQRLLGRLKSCFAEGAGNAINMDNTRGTAGIGGFLVFNACSSLYMGVKRGVATQFCALFPLRLGAKKRQAKAKNLHWIHYAP